MLMLVFYTRLARNNIQARPPVPDEILIFLVPLTLFIFVFWNRSPTENVFSYPPPRADIAG